MGRDDSLDMSIQRQFSTGDSMPFGSGRGSPDSIAANFGRNPAQNVDRVVFEPSQMPTSIRRQIDQLSFVGKQIQIGTRSDVECHSLAILVRIEVVKNTLEVVR